MIKSEYSVIGVMSGTSLDGIDLVYVNFSKNDKWHFNIIHAETCGYNEAWRDKLSRLVSYSDSDLTKVDTAYTRYLATVINGFIKKNDIKGIDAICSHGHTALHQPHKKLGYSNPNYH